MRGKSEPYWGAAQIDLADNNIEGQTVVHVALDWKRIDWQPDDTWKRDLLPRIEAQGLKPEEISRCVYVIRLNGNFCINYPRGQSPTIYIGEGRFYSRITKHKNWVAELKELVGTFAFQVCIAVPRVKNNATAYRDAEAAMIDFFGHKYGTTPLWNKQYESRLANYEYSERSIKEAVGKRRGAKYEWALTPMKSSPFHRYFHQPPRN